MPLIPDKVPISKRGFDLVLSTLGLIILSPILLIIAILIIIFQGLPVLFLQQRPGYKAKPFKIYKFRTMSDESGSDGTLLDEKQRTTRLGRILRATSLDEILELYNVFKGEMSVVGPRPLLMQYLSRYSSDKPGAMMFCRESQAGRK